MNSYERGNRNNQSNYRNRDNYNNQSRVDLNNFFDNNGNISVDWIDSKIKDFASDRFNCPSKTQIRNFYQEFLRIQLMPGDDAQKIVMIKMLKAKVKYKEKSSQDKVPRNFVTFIENLVNEIGDNLRKFNSACLLMEAFVAYNAN